MKKFRFVYWFGSCITDWSTFANSKQEALEKFEKYKGDRRIVSVEETEPSWYERMWRV